MLELTIIAVYAIVFGIAVYKIDSLTKWAIAKGLL